MKDNNLKKMIPFLDDEELELLVDKILESEEGIYKNVTIKDLLPFLDEDLIEKAFKSDINKNKDVSFYFPFLDDEFYDDIVSRMLENKKIDDKFYSYLPYLSEEILSKIVDSYLKDEIDLDINRVYPFLSDEDIRKIFRKSILD